MPPTLKTLEEMSRQPSMAEQLASLSSTNIQPIMPQILVEGDSIVIKLPHDPDYNIAELNQSHRPDEMSRVIIKDGRFNAFKFGEAL